MLHNLAVDVSDVVIKAPICLGTSAGAVRVTGSTQAEKHGTRAPRRKTNAHLR